MAKPNLRRSFPLMVATALTAAAVVLPTSALAVPDAPAGQPTVTSLQRQLSQLALQNSQLVEKYNQARVLADERAAQAARAEQAATRAKTAFESASLQMSRVLAVQYEGGSLSAATALLTSSDGQAYLDHVGAISMLSRHQAGVMSGLTSAKLRADAASTTAAKLLASAKADLAALSRNRADVQRQIDKYRTTLTLLTVAQRADYSSAINPKVTASTLEFVSSHLTGSRAAQAAVRFALAQVGKPYVFGAAGPDAFDCSGLTMAAWHAGGVSLPHSAADQYNYGHHVGLTQLSPGDLIFMYSPIGHVTIYIGNGLMVSAPTEGEPVAVVPVSSFSGDIVGATHLG